MPTPSGFHLTIPEYKPATVDAHERNLRAIERAINGLPFPRAQRLILDYDTGIDIAESDTHDFDLFDGNGYDLRERGVVNTAITVEWATLNPIDEYRIRFQSGHEFNIYSFGANGLDIHKAIVDTSGDPLTGFEADVTTFQGWWDLNAEITWQPQLTILAQLGDFRIRSIAVLHTFYPYGLMNSLRLNWETGT